MLMARFAFAVELSRGDPVQATQELSRVLKGESALAGLARATGLPLTSLQERCLTTMRALHTGLQGKIPLEEAELWAAERSQPGGQGGGSLL